MGIFTSHCKNCGKEINWFLFAPLNYICPKCGERNFQSDIEQSWNDEQDRHQKHREKSKIIQELIPEADHKIISEALTEAMENVDRAVILVKKQLSDLYADGWEDFADNVPLEENPYRFKDSDNSYATLKESEKKRHRELYQALIDSHKNTAEYKQWEKGWLDSKEFHK